MTAYPFTGRSNCETFWELLRMIPMAHPDLLMIDSLLPIQATGIVGPYLSSSILRPM